MYDFDELWNEFNQKLLKYFNAKVNNTQDAEDILQDVFIKIFSSIERLESQSAIKPWIYKITKNTIIDFCKKKKSISVAPETLYEIEDEKEDVDNMNDDISKCIGAMIFALPDKYQSVYDMYENKNLKHKEIAEALDISVSSSKVRLKRAKDMFKDELIKCCDFEVDNYGNIIDYHSKGKCKYCDGRC
ncbi:MAG: sigma-70 family RNA polymerase sigma factor [Peptostreptococcaceae bacterium]|nr:sigma-70 family RNA polymerase sigma factor [Peptostreptococcaceae bacterium]